MTVLSIATISLNILSPRLTKCEYMLIAQRRRNTSILMNVSPTEHVAIISFISKITSLTIIESHFNIIEVGICHTINFDRS